MLTLIIGGSGSGKSSFGEELAQKSNSKLYYLATMIPYGDEGKRRVERHLKLRKGKGFETIEEYMDIGNIDIPYGSCVLLEDLPNLVANNMFTKNPQKDINMFIVNGIVQLYNKVETVFLTTSAENQYLSSSVVKQIASFGGDIHQFVPEEVHDRIVHRLDKTRQ
mgnify:CR=1 FL=1